MYAQKRNSLDNEDSVNSENSLLMQRSYRSQSYKLKARRYFGISHKATKDLLFLNDSTVIHLTGRAVILDNLIEKTQFFINLKEVYSDVNLLAVSPNKKYLAVSELMADGPVISVYSLLQNKLIRTCRQPVTAYSRHKFHFITYTCDSSYLVAIIPEPDWNIVFYSAKTGMIHCILDKIGKRSKRSKVLQVCCHPSDPKQIMALGSDYYQLMKYKHSHWVPYGYQGNLNIKITGACWVTPIINVLGTFDGKLIFVEHGHIQGVFDALETEEIDLSMENFDKKILAQITDYERSLTYDNTNEHGHDSNEKEVKALVGFDNGFAFSCKGGEVIIFAANMELEHKLRWYKRGVYHAEIPTFGMMNTELIDTIQQICVSPNRHMIACTTLCQEIYYGNMKKDFHRNQMNGSNHARFKKLFGDLHQGPIASVSVARWKPYYMTVGSMDHSIILWNYKLNEKVFRSEFPEEICSASLHPTGLFCLIGFTDRIRLAAIYNLRFKFVREITVRSCSSVLFSHGGHLFAAVCGVNICIYSAVNFTCNYIFKGHNAPVQCVRFSSNDYYIFSSGMEGSVYMWGVRDGRKVHDCFTRSSATLGIDVLEEEDMIYLVGTDGCIRELLRGYLNRTFYLQLGSMYSAMFVNSGETLLVAGEEGIVLAIGLPIFSPIKYRQYTMHTAPVRQMLIPPDEDIMMSISDDGSVCLWDLVSPESMNVSPSRKSKQISEDKDSGDTFTSHSAEETFERYTTHVVIDMDDWIQGFDDMDELNSKLIENDKANEFVLWQTQVAFEMLTKHPDIEYLQEVAEIEMHINAAERDAIMKLHDCRAKIADMCIEDDQFDLHFTMQKYKLIERSRRIVKICTENFNKFFERVRKAMKQFSVHKNKILARAIDRHQQYEYTYSKVVANCDYELDEIENMRDEDAYYLRKEIQSEISYIYEWNRSYESNNKSMSVNTAKCLNKMSSVIDDVVYWLRACKSSKKLGIELQEEINYLRVEKEYLNMELERYDPISRFTFTVDRSYFNRTYVLNQLVTGVRNLLEPLYAICRNRMLRYKKLEERFNDKNAIFLTMKQRHIKNKTHHKSVRKAMINSWKRSSSIAKVFINLENETLFRAMYGYSPKALKAMLKVISKVQDRTFENAEHQESKQYDEIKRHRAFLERIIHTYKTSTKGKLMNKYIFKYVPAGTEEEDLSTLIHYTNKYIICSKVLHEKVKSLKKANYFNAPRSSSNESEKKFTRKPKVKSIMSKKKEELRNYYLTQQLLDSEITRWRNALEPNSSQTCEHKNETPLKQYVNTLISKPSFNRCTIFDN